MDISGFIDGYYSYNFNTPTSAANGQANDLYNFNDKTDQFNLMIASRDLPDIIEWSWISYPGCPEKAISDKIIIRLRES